MAANLPTIDPYSATSLPLAALFGDEQISTCTGFFWSHKEAHYLITNWHCVSGVHPQTGQVLDKKHGYTPTHLDVSAHWKGTSGTVRHIFRLALREEDSSPKWLIHPKFGKKIDIAALPIELPKEVEPYPINLMPANQLKVSVGMDVFIIGFPHGLHGPLLLPVWKRASVASEPGIFSNRQRYYLVDTASRPGMSGSPVIARSVGIALMETGNFQGGIVGTRLLGVYSGRLASENEFDAQLGMVWPIRYVTEIIEGQTRDAI